MRLIETIALTASDAVRASSELAELRHACSQHDIMNLNARKEIEYNEGLVNEQKEISSRNYQELTNLREVMSNLDKDLDAKLQRLEILKREMENNH